MKPNSSPSSNGRVRRGAAGRSTLSAAGTERLRASSPPPSDMHFPFPWLHYFLERRPHAFGPRGAFASLRVYFHCRVFFCQVRSAAKLVRESADVWLRFGRAGGNRAPRSTCSPAGVGEIPLLATGRHVCALRFAASRPRGEAGCWSQCQVVLGTANGAKRCGCCMCGT